MHYRGGGLFQRDFRNIYLSQTPIRKPICQEDFPAGNFDWMRMKGKVAQDGKV